MDGDLIFRSALKAAIEKEIWISDSTKAVFRNILANVPAVDAETVCEQMGLVKEAFEMAKADLVVVVRCKDCVTHGNCLTEDTFRIARIDNPFCCGGKRRADE